MPTLSSGKPSKTPAVRAALLLLATILLAGCASTGTVGDEPEAWGTVYRDQARTNAATGAVEVPLRTSWRADIRGYGVFNMFPNEELGSPVIHGGVVYVGSTSGRVFAFDLDTGKLRWQFKTGAAVESAPTVAGGMVCFGSTDGVMRCLDTGGGELWSFQARSEIISSPVVDGRRVIFSSSDDRLHALGAETGELEWTFTRGTFRDVSPRLSSSPALHDGRLYHYFNDGAVVCISANTGKALWSVKVAEGLMEAPRSRRTPLVSDGLVFVIGDGGRVTVLGAEDGKTRGVYNLIEARDMIDLPGRAFVIAGPDKVVAIDRLSGAILWKTELPSSPVETVMAAGNNLIVFSNTTTERLGIASFKKTRGYLQALDATTGAVVWTQKLPSSVSANASAYGNRLAILLDRGTLEVLEPR